MTPEKFRHAIDSSPMLMEEENSNAPPMMMEEEHCSALDNWNNWMRVFVPYIGEQRGYTGIVKSFPAWRNKQGVVANDDGYILEPIQPVPAFYPQYTLYRMTVTTIHEASGMAL